MPKTPRDAATKEPTGASENEGVTASGEHLKLDPVGCPHCGEAHPAAYSHCPRTGRPLQTGPALVGRVIAGRYKVTGILGEGGMGAVYVAEHLLVGRKVAIKRLHPELAGDEKAVARFQREARAAAATGHEHIVDVLDLGYAEDGAPYLVMEYLRGASLAQVLKQEGRLAPARAAHILGQVLAALAAVHAQQIVHRDLKPDNVFLTRRGGIADYVKVLDFGISKMKHEDGGPSDLTRTGVTMGTPFYMSPEQARGVRKLDHRVDLYAVAVIAYECLTGRLPLSGDNYHALLQQILRVEPVAPSAWVPGLPAGLDGVVLRGLAKDPSARYATAAEMLEALAPFGANPNELAGMVSTQPGPPPPERRGALDDALAPTGRAGPVRASGTSRRPADGPHDRVTLAGEVMGRSEPRPEPPGAEPSRPEPQHIDPARSTAARGERAGAERVGVERVGVERAKANAPSRATLDDRSVERGGEHGSLERRPSDTGPRYFYAQSEDWVDDSERRGGTSERGTPARTRVEPSASRLETSASHERAGDPLADGRAPAGTFEVRGVRDSAPTRVAREDGACKGSLVLGLLDHFEEAHGAAAARAWIARLTPETRAKVEGVILPMAWLPLSVLEELVQGLASDGDPARVSVSGRAVAAREMTTTHRLFSQTASPASALERLPHLHRVYFACGDLKVVTTLSGARIELDGTPPESGALVQWLAAFWQEVLTRAGARDVQVAATTARGRGDERSSIALRWR